MKIIFATHNVGKIKEMRALLRDLDVDVLSADEAGVTEDVVEDGETFEENALKKARFVCEKSGEWAVADDSGVCIKELGCRPGVMTARWAGEGATDEDLVRHTLGQMKDILDGRRDAYFESAAALWAPDGREWVFQGRVEGSISSEPRGTPRPKLPYDMIFIPRGHERTFAQMGDEEKNTLSHRGLAFQKLKKFLQKEICTKNENKR